MMENLIATGLGLALFLAGAFTFCCGRAAERRLQRAREADAHHTHDWLTRENQRLSKELMELRRENRHLMAELDSTSSLN